jgi:hypothetical protein
VGGIEKTKVSKYLPRRDSTLPSTLPERPLSFGRTMAPPTSAFPVDVRVRGYPALNVAEPLADQPPSTKSSALGVLRSQARPRPIDHVCEDELRGNVAFGDGPLCAQVVNVLDGRYKRTHAEDPARGVVDQLRLRIRRQQRYAMGEPPLHPNCGP